MFRKMVRKTGGRGGLQAVAVGVFRPFNEKEPVVKNLYTGDAVGIDTASGVHVKGAFGV